MRFTDDDATRMLQLATGKNEVEFEQLHFTPLAWLLVSKPFKTTVNSMGQLVSWYYIFSLVMESEKLVNITLDELSFTGQRQTDGLTENTDFFHCHIQNLFTLIDFLREKEFTI